jgi:hypothetical protein
MNKTSSQSEDHHRRRRSRLEVADLVAAFEQSGLNQTEYCRQHGLSLSTLKRYCTPMGDRGSSRSVRAEYSAPAVSLIPVEVVDRPAAHETEHTALYVELCGGRRIGVGGGFDAMTLLEEV